MLVAPVARVNPQEERVIEFKGINRRPMTDDGEMQDTFNLSADDYPNLSQRRSRMEYHADYIHPVQMIVKDEKLAVIDQVDTNRYRFYYNGELCSSLEWTSEPKMVAIGSKICFFCGNQHHWYQVKATDGVSQGSTGELGTGVDVNSSVGLWLAEDEIEIASGKQYMYEFLGSMNESTTEGIGALSTVFTSVDATSTLTINIGQRNEGTSQVKVTVEGTYTDVKFVAFEVGAQPVTEGTYEWRYAGYVVPKGGALRATDYIDVRGYVYYNGLSIRVKCFSSDGKIYTKTVDMADFGWDTDAFVQVNRVPRLEELFKMDDVIDVNGKSTTEEYIGDMTEAEYNILAEKLGLETQSGTVDMTITPAEYNALATALGLEAEVATTVDATITGVESAKLARMLELSVAREDADATQVGDLDTASVIARVTENDILFADKYFLITSVDTEEPITADSSSKVLNATPLDFPKPTLWYVLRSKSSPGKCTVLWTVACTTAISGTRENTTYQVQVQEDGTDDAWQTVLEMSSAKGNLPGVAADGVTFFSTDVQVPSVETVYNFRVIAKNKTARSDGTAMSGSPSSGYPQCIGRYSIYTVLGSLKLDRYCPDLDFVCEYNNRLWGCNSENNEIMASKLGDPTNWHYYQATSMDSFAASQGTDGKWTGCGVYSNHLMFFKENSIHKVYGSSPSTFQISTQKANGVKEGSDRSVAIIDDLVIYHSSVGWMAYTGDAPELISVKLGDVGYVNVAAGVEGKKYYCCGYDPSADRYDVLVFDTESGFWLREDNTHMTDFCNYQGLLMYIDDDTGKIMRIGAGDEEGIEWYAIFGEFDEIIEDKKVVSKLKARLTMSEGSTLNIYIKLDGGTWEQVQHFEHDSNMALVVPIVPRRCDRYSVKLQGVGRCRIESLLRIYRQASGRL